MGDHGWLWPSVKHDFYRDLEKLGHEIEGWDLVFFTGDLTQKATAEEFRTVNREIEALWEHLSQSGSAPALCVVPGNHDIRRVAQDSAVQKALTQLWWRDDDVRSRFWRERHCEYREAVRGYFEPYVQWLDTISVPRLPQTAGQIPGDFSARFTKGQVTVGIVGLNSSFLQVTAGDFKGALDVHVSQLAAVCDGDASAWTARNTMNVLLTHHPPSWLAPAALDHFRQEIYPPGRFFAQYCGHQHEPETSEFAEAGASPRRIRQAPSLFGLGTWEDGRTERIHGYSAGQYVFDVNGAFEKIWPRVAVKGRHGGLNLCPDHTFRLGENDCIITPIEVNVTSEPRGGRAALTSATARREHEDEDQALQMFEESIPLHAAQAQLLSCPTMKVVAYPQHTFIRLEEQSQFEAALRSSRCVWLVADWGTGLDGFLGASLDRFRQGSSELPAFRLRCQDVLDVDTFEAVFAHQFGLPLRRFCSVATRLERVFLIVDEVHLAAWTTGAQDLRLIVAAMLDYCPVLSVVVSSRLTPENSAFATMHLGPLDAPDVRSYIMHHPLCPSSLSDPDVIEKLHERSGGLPMHLDRMIDALRVSSVTGVLDAADARETDGGMLRTSARLLMDAISALSRSRDRRSRRSYRLLSVLAMLPYGETLDTLRNFLPTDPFFEDNAIQLANSALLDVVSLPARVAIGQSSTSILHDPPKVLKVPKQVRDCVLPMLSDEEREAILLAGMERFFGRRWREGLLKFRRWTAEYEAYVDSGVGNELAVLLQLIAHSKQHGDEGTAERVVRVGLQYAARLEAADRYRDVAAAAGQLAAAVDEESFGDALWRLCGLAGAAFRMLGKHTEALAQLKRAVEIAGDSMTAAEKCRLFKNIARAENSLKNLDDALSAAEEAKVHAKPTQSAFWDCEYIIAKCRLEGDALKKRLGEILQEAKKLKAKTLVENLLLDLAELATGQEKVGLLDAVLDSSYTQSYSYNKQRAVLAKARAVEEHADAEAFTKRDLNTLVWSYSYLYSQRFGGPFDQCHDALWRIFEGTSDIGQLLRLFRHSSFVWRIRGDEGKERTALLALAAHPIPRIEELGSKADLPLRYYWKRHRALLPAM
jgi:tetratricopeptide (TPR) repeat protein